MKKIALFALVILVASCTASKQLKKENTALRGQVEQLDSVSYQLYNGLMAVTHSADSLIAQQHEIDSLVDRRFLERDEIIRLQQMRYDEALRMYDANMKLCGCKMDSVQARKKRLVEAYKKKNNL